MLMTKRCMKPAMAISPKGAPVNCIFLVRRSSLKRWGNIGPDSLQGVAIMHLEKFGCFRFGKIKLFNLQFRSQSRFGYGQRLVNQGNEPAAKHRRRRP